MKALPLVFALMLVLLAPLVARGQIGAVRGVVTDEDDQPLPGVNVVLQGTQRGTATNTEGRFEIEGIPAGDYILAASSIGFLPEQQAITIVPGTALTVAFVLREMVIESGEVVVTAGRRAQRSSRVPASISVLPPRALEVRNVVALDDALRYVPGVQMQGNQVNIRGSSGFAYNTGSRVLLLLDGIPLLTPDTDGMPFDALPFAQIAQVEILKGPGSALYGSGALGGVINVITRAYPDKPETLVRLFGGMYEPVRYEEWTDQWPDGQNPRPMGGLTISHARKFNPKLGMWLDLSYRKDSGYLNFSAFDIFRGYAKMGWRPQPHLRFDLLTGIMLRERDNFFFWNGARDVLNPGNLTLDNDPDPVDPTGTSDAFNNQISLLPSFTHLVNARFFYAIKARVFGTVIRGINNETGKPEPLDDGTLGFRYGGEVQFNWEPLLNRHLTAGASFDANTTRSSFFVSSDGDDIGSQPEAALFAQWEQPLLNRLDVVAGLRFDTYRIDVSETASKLSPKLSAAYRFGDPLTLRAAYGQGFRVPSLAERFTDNQDFIPIVRNPFLQPEESESIEIGLRSQFQLAAQAQTQIDLAVFWNHYENLIEPKFSPPVQAFQFVNLTRARIRGAEAVADLLLRDGTVKLQLGYTFLDADDLTTNEPLASRARHHVVAGIDAVLYGPLEAGLDLRYSSTPERIDSDFTRFVPDADYVVPIRVFDAWIGLRWDRFRVSLIAKNALEYYYVERPALLAPPRHYILQLQGTF